MKKFTYIIVFSKCNYICWKIFIYIKHVLDLNIIQNHTYIFGGFLVRFWLRSLPSSPLAFLCPWLPCWVALEASFVAWLGENNEATKKLWSTLNDHKITGFLCTPKLKKHHWISLFRYPYDIYDIYDTWNLFFFEVHDTLCLKALTGSSAGFVWLPGWTQQSLRAHLLVSLWLGSAAENWHDF